MWLTKIPVVSIIGIIIKANPMFFCVYIQTKYYPSFGKYTTYHSLERLAMVKNIFIREVKIAYNSSSQYGQQSHRDHEFLFHLHSS